MSDDALAAAEHPVLVGVLATSIGGAAGALARWSLTTAVPVEPGHFPWTTWAINVGGSALLAGLPLLAVVRSRRWLALLLGTGLLGGFTTMSAASTETFALIDGGDPVLAAAYLLGTVGAALLAVLVVDRWTTPEDRLLLEVEEADE